MQTTVEKISSEMPQVKELYEKMNYADEDFENAEAQVKALKRSVDEE